ncbi:MAG: twin-arginine translocation signal domain-containing protein, partial [Cytophagales bacterium]
MKTTRRSFIKKTSALGAVA